MLGFYVQPTAKVIRRQDLGLKSHPKDSRTLVHKASSFTCNYTGHDEDSFLYASLTCGRNYKTTVNM